jgi:hypothetical protein
MKTASWIACLFLIAAPGFGGYPPKPNLVREPAIIVAVDTKNETVTIRFPKPPRDKSTADYKPVLDAKDCKVFFVSPTHRKERASLANLQPEMEVLVTGSWSRWTPYALEIRIPRK